MDVNTMGWLGLDVRALPLRMVLVKESMFFSAVIFVCEDVLGIRFRVLDFVKNTNAEV